MGKKTMDIRAEANSILIEHGELVLKGDCVSSFDGHYIKFGELLNDIPFTLVGIKDKYLFQKKVLGYSYEKGRFPYCNTRDDAIKLLKAVVEYNNKILCGRRRYKHIKFNFKL